MKIPSLAILAAVVFAAPACAEISRRCNEEWLKQAQKAVQNNQDPVDPDHYLKRDPVSQSLVFDVEDRPQVCDETVWYYLGRRNLDNNWSSGNPNLAQQIKIVEDTGDFFAVLDQESQALFSKAETIANLAVKIGVASRKDGDDLHQLAKKHFTKPEFAQETSFMLVAPDPKSKIPMLKFEDIKGILGQILVDVPGEKGTKPGPAVQEFRDGVVAFANYISFGYGEGQPFRNDYQAALKYLTDPKINTANDESDRPGALSKIDYGMRNLIALRAAAVDEAVRLAQKNLGGQSVAVTLAHAARAAKDADNPGAPKVGTVSADVMKRLGGIKDYSDLSALYDKNKANRDWLKSDQGQAVAAYVEGLRGDASRITRAWDGHSLQFSVGGKKIVDTGIAVANLRTNPSLRQSTVEDLTNRIVSANPLDAQAQAALAAVRGAGASGSQISAPLTPDQRQAASRLPVPSPTTPAPPKTPYELLLAATPAAWPFDFRSNVARYRAKEDEDFARMADGQSRQRTLVESEAETASRSAQNQVDAGRRKIQDMTPDPDDTPAMAILRKDNDLQAYDEKHKNDARTAYRKVISDATALGRYVGRGDSYALLRTKQFENEDFIKSAYDDGIVSAIEKLKGEYESEGSSRRRLAENKSGYTGQYYRVARVDDYFKKNWGEKSSVEKCKAALGFSNEAGFFLDPSVENVDVKCGVRSGLIAHLAKYKGSNSDNLGGNP